MAEHEGSWVVAPDEARIEIAVGTEATLTPALTEALENLARAVEGQQEVQGYYQCQTVHVGTCRMLLICSSVTQ